MINKRGITSLITLTLSQIRGMWNHKCTYKTFSSSKKWVFWIPAIIFIIKILPHNIFTAQHFISHYNVHSWSVRKCHRKAAICFRFWYCLLCFRIVDKFWENFCCYRKIYLWSRAPYTMFNILLEDFYVEKGIPQARKMGHIFTRRNIHKHIQCHCSIHTLTRLYKNK